MTPENGRFLLQQAAAGALGTESASAAAAAVNIGGQTAAATQSSATGPGSTTFGVSAAQGQIDTCINGTNYNASVCRTLAPRDRARNCTNIPPDARFSCQQQAVEYGKCNATFMFLDSYCLRSCNRCGGNCTDVTPPDGTSCNSTLCGTQMYIAGPVCLKTCGRCSPA